MKLAGKKLSYYLIFMLFLICSTSLNAQEEDYKIQRGDMISISVMEHKEFTVEDIVVLPDGCLQFPVLGYVNVTNMTPKELSDQIAEALTQYVVNPIVTVYLRDLKNQDINVLGFLNQPGKYQIFESVSVLSAISYAGGIKQSRKVKYIEVIRLNGTRRKVKMKQFLENPEIFAEVKPGDTIYVQERTPVNWSLFSFISTLTYAVAILTR